MIYHAQVRKFPLLIVYLMFHLVKHVIKEWCTCDYNMIFIISYWILFWHSVYCKHCEISWTFHTHASFKWTMRKMCKILFKIIPSSCPSIRTDKRGKGGGAWTDVMTTPHAWVCQKTTRNNSNLYTIVIKMPMYKIHYLPRMLREDENAVRKLFS